MQRRSSSSYSSQQPNVAPTPLSYAMLKQQQQQLHVTPQHVGNPAYASSGNHYPVTHRQASPIHPQENNFFTEIGLAVPPPLKSSVPIPTSNRRRASGNLQIQYDHVTPQIQPGLTRHYSSGSNATPPLTPHSGSMKTPPYFASSPQQPANAQRFSSYLPTGVRITGNAAAINPDEVMKQQQLQQQLQQLQAAQGSAKFRSISSPPSRTRNFTSPPTTTTVPPVGPNHQRFYSGQEMANNNPPLSSSGLTTPSNVTTVVATVGNQMVHHFVSPVPPHPHAASQQGATVNTGVLGPTPAALLMRSSKHPSFHPVGMGARRSRSSATSPARRTQSYGSEDFGVKGVGHHEYKEQLFFPAPPYSVRDGSDGIKRATAPIPSSSSNLPPMTAQQFIYQQLTNRDALSLLLTQHGLQTSHPLNAAALEALLSLPPELVPDDANANFDQLVRQQEMFGELIAQALSQILLQQAESSGGEEQVARQQQNLFPSLDALQHFMRQQATAALLGQSNNNNNNNAHSNEQHGHGHSRGSSMHSTHSTHASTHQSSSEDPNHNNADKHRHFEELLEFLRSRDALSLFQSDPKTGYLLDCVHVENDEIASELEKSGYELDEHTLEILHEIARSNEEAIRTHSRAQSAGGARPTSSKPLLHMPYQLYNLRELFELLAKISDTFHNKGLLRNLVEKYPGIQAIIDFLPSSNLFPRKIVVTLPELEKLYCNEMETKEQTIRFLRDISRRIEWEREAQYAEGNTGGITLQPRNEWLSENMAELTEKVVKLARIEREEKEKRQLSDAVLLAGGGIGGAPGRFGSARDRAASASGPSDRRPSFSARPAIAVRDTHLGSGDQAIADALANLFQALPLPKPVSNTVSTSSPFIDQLLGAADANPSSVIGYLGNMQSDRKGFAKLQGTVQAIMNVFEKEVQSKSTQTDGTQAFYDPPTDYSWVEKKLERAILERVTEMEAARIDAEKKLLSSPQVPVMQRLAVRLAGSTPVVTSATQTPAISDQLDLGGGIAASPAPAAFAPTLPPFPTNAEPAPTTHNPAAIAHRNQLMKLVSGMSNLFSNGGVGTSTSAASTQTGSVPGTPIQGFSAPAFARPNGSRPSSAWNLDRGGNAASRGRANNTPSIMVITPSDIDHLIKASGAGLYTAAHIERLQKQQNSSNLAPVQFQSWADLVVAIKNEQVKFMNFKQQLLDQFQHPHCHLLADASEKQTLTLADLDSLQVLMHGSPRELYSDLLFPLAALHSMGLSFANWEIMCACLNHYAGDFHTLIDTALRKIRHPTAIGSALSPTEQLVSRRTITSPSEFLESLSAPSNAHANHLASPGSTDEQPEFCTAFIVSSAANGLLSKDALQEMVTSKHPLASLVSSTHYSPLLTLIYLEQLAAKNRSAEFSYASTGVREMEEAQLQLDPVARVAGMSQAPQNLAPPNTLMHDLMQLMSANDQAVQFVAQTCFHHGAGDENIQPETLKELLPRYNFRGSASSPFDAVKFVDQLFSYSSCAQNTPALLKQLRSQGATFDTPLELIGALRKLQTETKRDAAGIAVLEPTSIPVGLDGRHSIPLPHPSVAALQFQPHPPESVYSPTTSYKQLNIFQRRPSSIMIQRASSAPKTQPNPAPSSRATTSTSTGTDASTDAGNNTNNNNNNMFIMTSEQKKAFLGYLAADSGLFASTRPAKVRDENDEDNDDDDLDEDGVRRGGNASSDFVPHFTFSAQDITKVFQAAGGVENALLFLNTFANQGRTFTTLDKLLSECEIMKLKKDSEKQALAKLLAANAHLIGSARTNDPAAPFTDAELEAFYAKTAQEAGVGNVLQFVKEALSQAADRPAAIGMDARGNRVEVNGPAFRTLHDLAASVTEASRDLRASQHGALIRYAQQLFNAPVNLLPHDLNHLLNQSIFGPQHVPAPGEAKANTGHLDAESKRELGIRSVLHTLDEMVKKNQAALAASNSTVNPPSPTKLDSFTFAASSVPGVQLFGSVAELSAAVTENELDKLQQIEDLREYLTKRENFDVLLGEGAATAHADATPITQFSDVELLDFIHSTTPAVGDSLISQLQELCEQMRTAQRADAEADAKGLPPSSQSSQPFASLGALSKALRAHAAQKEKARKSERLALLAYLTHPNVDLLSSAEGNLASRLTVTDADLDLLVQKSTRGIGSIASALGKKENPATADANPTALEVLQLMNDKLHAHFDSFEALASAFSDLVDEVRTERMALKEFFKLDPANAQQSVDSDLFRPANYVNGNVVNRLHNAILLAEHPDELSDGPAASLPSPPSLEEFFAELRNFQSQGVVFDSVDDFVEKRKAYPRPPVSKSDAPAVRVSTTPKLLVDVHASPSDGTTPAPLTSGTKRRITINRTRSGPNGATPFGVTPASSHDSWMSALNAIFFVGLPGSGSSFLIKQLAKDYDFLKIDMRELIRVAGGFPLNMASQPTDFEKEVASLLNHTLKVGAQGEKAALECRLAVTNPLQNRIAPSRKLVLLRAALSALHSAYPQKTHILIEGFPATKDDWLEWNGDAVHSMSGDPTVEKIVPSTLIMYHLRSVDERLAYKQWQVQREALRAEKPDMGGRPASSTGASASALLSAENDLPLWRNEADEYREQINRLLGIVSESTRVQEILVNIPLDQSADDPEADPKAMEAVYNDVQISLDTRLSQGGHLPPEAAKSRYARAASITGHAAARGANGEAVPATPLMTGMTPHGSPTTTRKESRIQMSPDGSVSLEGFGGVPLPASAPSALQDADSVFAFTDRGHMSELKEQQEQEEEEAMQLLQQQQQQQQQQQDGLGASDEAAANTTVAPKGTIRIVPRAASAHSTKYVIDTHPLSSAVNRPSSAAGTRNSSAMGFHDDAAKSHPSPNSATGYNPYEAFMGASSNNPNNGSSNAGSTTSATSTNVHPLAPPSSHVLASLPTMPELPSLPPIEPMDDHEQKEAQDRKLADEQNSAQNNAKLEDSASDKHNQLADNQSAASGVSADAVTSADANKTSAVDASSDANRSAANDGTKNASEGSTDTSAVTSPVITATDGDKDNVARLPTSPEKPLFDINALIRRATKSKRQSSQPPESAEKLAVPVGETPTSSASAARERRRTRRRTLKEGEEMLSPSTKKDDLASPSSSAAAPVSPAVPEDVERNTVRPKSAPPLPPLTPDTEIVLDIHCESLDRMHLLIKASPYLEIYQCHRADVELKKQVNDIPLFSGSQNQMEVARGNFFESVYKTETCRQNLDPVFRRIIISGATLCQMDWDRLIMFRVWDESRDLSDNVLMGEAQASLREIFQPLYQSWPHDMDAVKVALLRPELKLHKKGYVNSGFLVFTSVVRYKKITKIPSSLSDPALVTPTKDDNVPRKKRAGRMTMMDWKKEDLKELKTDAAPAENSSKEVMTPRRRDLHVPTKKEEEKEKEKEKESKKKKKSSRKSHRRDASNMGSSSAISVTEDSEDDPAESQLNSPSANASSSSAAAVPPRGQVHHIAVITMIGKNLPKPGWFSFTDPNPFVTIYGKQSIVEAWTARLQQEKLADKQRDGVASGMSDAMVNTAMNRRLKSEQSSVAGEKETDIWVPLFSTEIKYNNMAPEFDPFVLDVSALSNGDWDAPLQISLSYSSSTDKVTKPDQVGSTVITLRELLTGSSDPEEPVNALKSDASSDDLSITANVNQKQLTFTRQVTKLARNTLVGSAGVGTQSASELAEQVHKMKRKQSSRRAQRPDIALYMPGKVAQGAKAFVNVKAVILLESMPSFHTVTAPMDVGSYRVPTNERAQPLPPTTPSPGLTMGRQTQVKRYSTLMNNQIGKAFTGASSTNGGDNRRASIDLKEMIANAKLNINPVAAAAQGSSPAGSTLAAPTDGTGSTRSQRDRPRSSSRRRGSGSLNSKSGK